jgi:DNA-binding transcriptional MerR regulator
MAPKARVQKRLYYKIGEACKALGIQPYVLRYWETEFPALSPSKSRSGQRVYSEKELEVIRRIKQLLYDEGYTIAGAKKKLEGELAAGTLGEPVATAATPLAPAPAPPSPPPAPAVFQAPAAGRARGQAAETAPAVGGLAAVGPRSDGPAAAATPGAARTVPLPLAPWPPAADKPGTADQPGAAAASPGLASPAAPARLDGPGSGTATAAVEEGASRGASTDAPAPAGQDLEGSPPLVSRPTLPLTPPWPPLQAVPATAAPSSEGSAAKAATPTSRKAASRQAPTAATPATTAVAGDHAAGPEAASASPPAASGPGHELDTAAAKQIETLRKGITKALQGAREILALLDSRSPR